VTKEKKWSKHDLWNLAGFWVLGIAIMADGRIWTGAACMIFGAALIILDKIS
jgi:hypothetical protein